MNKELYGAIEGGGTKFICAVGNAELKIVEKVEIPTTTPGETMGKVSDFFRSKDGIKKIGIGCFGPIDTSRQSNNYGLLTNTPKAGWSGVNVVKLLQDSLGVEVLLETDVNCAAIGEHAAGTGKDYDSFVYITVGTGIGGAAFVESKLLNSDTHSEMGHIRVYQDPEDSFEGSCPFHKNCLEGLASGPAIESRCTQKPELVDDPQAWSFVADYLAQGITNYCLILGTQTVIVGGGVFSHPGLVESVNARAGELLNGYMKPPKIIPATADNALVGALELASS